MDRLCDLILLGKFDKAAKIAKQYLEKEVFNSIIKAVMDSESEMFYLFYLSKLIKKENANDHYYASEILFNGINFLDGAYDKALYHIKRAMQLDENNIGYKEFYLIFYRHPDLLVQIPDEEYLQCIEDILAINPTNETARCVKKKILNRN